MKIKVLVIVCLLAAIFTAASVNTLSSYNTSLEPGGASVGVDVAELKRQDRERKQQQALAEQALLREPALEEQPVAGAFSIDSGETASIAEYLFVDEAGDMADETELQNQTVLGAQSITQPQEEWREQYYAQYEQWQQEAYGPYVMNPSAGFSYEETLVPDMQAMPGEVDILASVTVSHAANITNQRGFAVVSGSLIQANEGASLTFGEQDGTSQYVLYFEPGSSIVLADGTDLSMEGFYAAPVGVDVFAGAELIPYADFVRYCGENGIPLQAK